MVAILKKSFSIHFSTFQCRSVSTGSEFFSQLKQNIKLVELLTALMGTRSGSFKNFDGSSVTKLTIIIYLVRKLL